MELFEILNIPSDEYFLTGSRALDNENVKISTMESDYDYVLLIFNKHIILDYLKQINIEIIPSDYNSGFKFRYKDQYINVISVITCEFMAWREALEIIKMLIKKDAKYQNAIINKMSRYCIYEQFRGLIKTIIKLGE